MGGGVILFGYKEFINSVLYPGTGGGFVLPLPPSPGLPGQLPDVTAVSAIVPDGNRPKVARANFSISSSDDSARERLVDLYLPAPEWNRNLPVDHLLLSTILANAVPTISVDAGLRGFSLGVSLTTSDD